MIATLHRLRTHERKSDDITDRGGTCEEHHEPVNADTDSRVLLDEICHAGTSPRRLKVEDLPTERVPRHLVLDRGRANDCQEDVLPHPFEEAHHVGVVPPRAVALHHGELWIVRPIDA